MSREFIIHVDAKPKHVDAKPKEHSHMPKAVKPKKRPAPARNNRAWRAFLIILLVLIGAGFLFYFIQIESAFERKPELEKPKISASLEEFVIKEEYLGYLLNEMGAFKLQKIPFSRNVPEMEILITDTGEIFTARNIDNSLQTVKGAAENPDIRISSPKDVMYDVLKADEPKQALLDEYSLGRLSIELLKGEKELILKGYKGIYDALNI